MAAQVSESADIAAGETIRRSRPGASELLPRPPLLFEDRERRRIELRRSQTVEESLVSMYADYEPADRAQGLPPVTESGVRAWLDDVYDRGIHLVAWHDDAAVGHATLVPAGDGTFELAIFVASDYQHAGIGSRLLRTVLGCGRAEGVDRVWLTVTRDNRAAISLYRKTGFRTVESGLDLEMERRV